MMRIRKNSLDPMKLRDFVEIGIVLAITIVLAILVPVVIKVVGMV